MSAEDEDKSHCTGPEYDEHRADTGELENEKARRQKDEITGPDQRSGAHLPGGSGDNPDHGRENLYQEQP